MTDKQNRIVARLKQGYTLSLLKRLNRFYLLNAARCGPPVNKQSANGLCLAKIVVRRPETDDANWEDYVLVTP